MNPTDELGERNSQRIVKRPIRSDRKQRSVVLEARPRDFLALDQIDLQTHPERYLDAGTGNFTIALRSVAIAEKQQRAGNVHRQVEGVTRTRFGRIHVAAELAGHNRTARLTSGGATPMHPRNGCIGIVTV